MRASYVLHSASKSVINIEMLRSLVSITPISFIFKTHKFLKCCF